MDDRKLLRSLEESCSTGGLDQLLRAENPLKTAVLADFDEAWKDVQTIIGDGRTIYTLSRGAPNRIQLRSNDEIRVETSRGTEPLPRDWVKKTWEILSASGVLGEQSLPEPVRYRSSFLLALLATLPYVDYVTHPRMAIFLTSHEFTNDLISQVFGVGTSSGIRYAGGAENPRHIVFITGGNPGSSKEHPYADRWEGERFYYTGEGLRGDQKMSKGNLALKRSMATSCPVYGFEKKRPNSYVYLGRFRVVDSRKRHNRTNAVRGAMSLSLKWSQSRPMDLKRAAQLASGKGQLQTPCLERPKGLLNASPSTSDSPARW